MAEIAAFLAIVWCYDCTPPGWITDDHHYKTRAECEHYVKDVFHYTSAYWKYEAKDKLRDTAHKPWCLATLENHEQGN